MVPHLNKLESHSPKDASCNVWLKLAQWFWKRRRKCEKCTTTTTTTENGQILIRKAHLSFQQYIQFGTIILKTCKDNIYKSLGPHCTVTAPPPPHHQHHHTHSEKLLDGLYIMTRNKLLSMLLKFRSG